jgi:tetratricopeptide (TPR) repeat protein
MIYHSYPAGEVIWRTRGPLRFSGYIQSGEIDLEFRVDGVPIRSIWLRTGDTLPPRSLQTRRLHDTAIATALTDVRIGILPEAKAIVSSQVVPQTSRMRWIWPVLLLTLVILLARDDLVRITSGLFYLASRPGEAASSQSPISMRLLQAAQKVDGRAAFAYNEAGYRQFQQGQLTDAEAAFDQAVSRDPDSAPGLNNLAAIYFIQGDPLQAENYLQRAMEQNPDNPIARYNFGITLMQSHDPVPALRAFREASFIDPSNSLPLLQQAYLYSQMGDYANAEQRARSALKLNPSLVPGHMLLGIALYNQGKDTEAQASFTQAESLAPGNRTATFYQALILGHQKQYAAALPILHELLTTSQDPDESVRILAELDALYRFQAEAAAAGR